MEKNIIGFKASNFKETALQKWDLIHREDELIEDPIVLRQLLKEAQIKQIELELEREELFQIKDLLKEAGQEAQIGIWELNMSTEKINWSSVSGYLEEEANDISLDIKNILNLYKEGTDRDQMKLLIQRAIEKGESYDVEMPLTNSKGEEIWIRTIGKTEMRDGKCIRLYGIFQDITEHKVVAEQLAKKEGLLSSILDTLPIAVFAKDIRDEYKFLLCNKTGEELFNFPEGSCIGKTDYDFFSKEEADWFRKKDIEAIKSGGIIDIPEELIHEGAEQIVLHTKKTIVRDAFNKPLFLVGIAEDITAKKASERLLKETNEKFEAIFNGSNDAVMLLYRLGAFFDCNPKTLEMFVVKDTTAFSKLNVSDLSPEFQPDGRTSNDSANEKISYALEHGACRFYWQHRRSTGELFDTEVSLSGIFYEGKHVLQAVIRDISEEKEAERALQKSKDQLETLFGLSPDFMFKSRISDLKFVDINQRACAFYGYTKEEFLELNLFDIEMHPRKKLFRDTVYDSLPIGEVLELEGMHRKKDGSTFPVFVRVCKLDEEYELATITDVTERKKQEAELQKLSFVAQKTDNAVLILDEQVKIEWVNEGFEKMTGYTSDDAIGNKIGVLLEGTDYTDSFEEELKANVTQNKVSLYEIPGYKKNKQLYWRSSSITPFLGSDGLFKYIVIESDITEQKRIANVIKESEALSAAKDLVERSEKRLAEAQGIANVGYWELNHLTGEEVWSEQLYRIFETSRDVIAPTEQNFLQHLHIEDRERAHTSYLDLAKTQKPYHITYRLLLPNGKIKYVNERCRAEFDENGQPWRSIGTIQDITEQKIGEDNLRKSLKEIQDLKYALDQSAMVLTISKDAKIITANTNFCFTSQYTEKELIGCDFQMTDSNYHSKWFLKNLWDTVERGDVWKGDLKNKTKDNTYYWVDTAMIPFVDEQGVIFQYVVIQRDITEKKRLEEELEQSNEAEFAKLYQQQQLHIAEIEERSAELDRFFDLSIDMICVLTPDGYIKRLNPAFSKALGYTKEELFSKPLLDLIHPDDLKDTRKHFIRLVEGDDIRNFENRCRTKNNQYRWMSWRIVLDKEKRLIYSIARDITEERNATKKIEDLTYTLNQTAIVMIVNRDEKIISVNDKFCEISGYDRVDVIGKHHEILDSFHHSDTFWGDLMTTIQSGKIWQGEIKERAKDGSFYWTYTSSVPFLNEVGEIVQYIVIQTDITDRKQLEKDLRQAKEEAIKNAKIKEDFLANMSHEIRTPMSGVLGFSRLLLQTSMDSTQRNYAQSIYGSAENLLVVVNDILDVSKIESGKFQLDEIEFDLRKRIEDSLNILRVDIYKKQLELILDIDPLIPRKILGVPDRLSQILINLVGNAIKFTKYGAIHLSVKKIDDVLFFEVLDTGIGIASDKLDAIFETFTQAESYTTREYGGTGLGLSISKKLVLLMGGEIGVKSTLGKGSSFYFSLPFKTILSSILEDEEDQEETLALPQLGQKLRILVVEDNLVNQELALIYLDMLHCNADLANNGEEALLRLSQQSYDLILMDIQMPKMDGIAATLEIRKEDTTTPIIAMSAHALSKEKEKCFNIGMNDYIAKPFKIEALRTIIIKHTQEILISSQGRAEIKVLPPIEIPTSSKNPYQVHFEHLLTVTDGNEGLAQELLLLFKEELAKFSANMDLAFESNNRPIIQKHLHKIKPNLELLHLDELYQICDLIVNC
ncbi:MAG: PAS domain S-box protein [Aureispira sp.]|nr:PAS domain S-box protein [Aureispira sp.]